MKLLPHQASLKAPPCRRLSTANRAQIRDEERCTAENVQASSPLLSSSRPKYTLRLQEITGDVCDEYVATADGWQTEARAQRSTSAKFIERVKGALLPDGYPASVTPDYLDYQLWAVPTHITGWLATSLVTSTLLTAVGISASPTGAAAASAAIKWITKDGVGALGRFLVGGSLGRYFDEDPRFWRMVAAGIFFGGAALEIITVRTPSAFVVLATTGNLAKAVAKGIARPSFRVVQNHFAAGNNVGDVSAKEEIWEVCGQMTGLLLSIGILTGLSHVPDPSGALIITAWVTAQAANLGFRLKALSVLQLPWLSQKRVSLLAALYVRGKPLPSVRALCSQESFLTPKQLLKPAVVMNATVTQLARAAEAMQAASSEALARAAAASRSGASDGEFNWRRDRADAPAESGAIPADLTSGNGGSGERSAQANASANGGISTRMNSTSADGNDDGGNGSDRVHSSASSSTAPRAGDDLSLLVAMYASEEYVLVPAADGFHVVPGLHVLVGVKQGAAPKAMLQAMLQAAWLDAALHGRTDVDMAELLVESLRFAQNNASGFVLQLQDAGWKIEDVRMRSRQSCVLRITDS